MSKRQSKEEKRREYDRLNAYIDRFFFHFHMMHGMRSFANARPDPRFDSEEWREAEIEYYGLSSLLSGTKEAVSDTIQMSVDLKADQVRTLDAALRADGVPTLSEMRVRFSRRWKSILKRGRIRSDPEFRIVAGILADLDCGVSAEERAALEKMSFEYEQRA